MRRILLDRYHALDLFRFAIDRRTAGERTVLIFITDVNGSSARPVGTVMVVTNGGVYAGYVSNGCVDSDIALHALETLKTGEMKIVRYGEGSPFMDIQLPCGGGLTACLVPDPDVETLAEFADTLAARQAVRITLDGRFEISDEGELGYTPPLIISAAGRGEDFYFFLKTARAMGIECRAMSPDAEVLVDAAKLGAKTLHLEYGQSTTIDGDPWTAFVLLFHDHDHEAPILKEILEIPAFYIGAMGSRRTHAARQGILKEMGVASSQIERVRGPVGLIPSMRDAGRLSVSILAEIIQAEANSSVFQGTLAD
ncbi:MAG: XdhC family protein [Maricaulaceae bacterium]